MTMEQRFDEQANKYETFRQVIERILSNFRHDAYNKFEVERELEKLFNQMASQEIHLALEAHAKAIMPEERKSVEDVGGQIAVNGFNSAIQEVKDRSDRFIKEYK